MRNYKVSEKSNSTTSGSGVSGLTATRVPFALNGTTLEDDILFNFDKANKWLTVGRAIGIAPIHIHSRETEIVPIQVWENNLGDIAQYISNASPEGFITADIGDKCTDVVGNAKYVKTTNGTDTGWRLEFGKIPTNRVMGNMSGANEFPVPLVSRDVFDANQQTYTYNIGGINEYIPGTVLIQTNTVTVSNSDTENTILGSGIGTKSLYATFFTVGKTLKGNVKGAINTNASVAPTLHIRIKLGGTTILDSDVQDLSIVSGGFFELDFELVCITVGIGGTMKGFARFKYQDDDFSNEIVFDAFTPIGVNTSLALALDATVEFGTADANNIIVSHLARIRREA